VRGVTTAGAASCWGINAEGQLGRGTVMDDSIPGMVPAIPTFKVLASGIAHTCGVSGGDTTYCWGTVGDSTHLPVPIAGPP
jgi:hypothetical protein